jgi:hypothetical protein
MFMGPLRANLLIFLGLFLVLLALLYTYWRFLTYRSKALRRHRKGTSKAQKDGLEVPPDISEEISKEED